MTPRRVTVGIDPGKGGALVALTDQGAQPPFIIRNVMPVIGTKRPEYDLVELLAVLTGYQELTGEGGSLSVYVERQQPMPAAMGGGAANYGRGYALGILEGLMVALGLRYEVVSPRRWQRDMLADIPGDDTKARAEIAARRLFPRADLTRSERARKADKGIVDALLIAEWGRRRS